MTSTKSAHYTSMWKGANALKRLCHTTINTLGPQTPPEAFLYRGNAYYALGQPYFALADYNTAASVLTLSGQHQVRCLRALARFPETQICTFPSSDAHLHIFVKPMLSEGVEVRHHTAETAQERLGRGLFAVRALATSASVIHDAEPWLRYSTADERCSHCCRPLPDRSFSCSNANCHEEYCSRDCRAMALSQYHKSVCENQGFQSIELDVYAQMQQAEKSGDITARNAAAAQLLMLRVLATALQAHIVPSVMGEVRLLTGRLTFSPHVLSDSMLHLYDRLARSLGIATIVSYEELIGVLARITANCFHHDGMIELNLPWSLMNHSCDANVAQQVGSTSMVTTRDVQPGEELCINYYPQLKHLPYEARTQELRKRHFVCECARCQKETKTAAPHVD